MTISFFWEERNGSHTAATISKLATSPITIQKCYLAERLSIEQGEQDSTAAYPQ